MANPALAVDQPDVEAFLVSLLPSTCRVWTLAAEHRYPFWTVRYTLRVTTTGGSKQGASDSAWAAHRVVLGSVNQPWDDGVVLNVMATLAPAWSPLDNGTPRYAAEYELIARPRSA